MSFHFSSASDTFEPQFNTKDDVNAIAPLMTFRKFLMTQEEGVSDNAEAVKKYNEYKIEYMKNAALRFFEAHKDEEWFVLFCTISFQVLDFLGSTINIFLDNLKNDWKKKRLLSKSACLYSKTW